MYTTPYDFTTLADAMKTRIAAFLFVFFLAFTLFYLVLTAFSAVPEARRYSSGAEVVGEPAISDGGVPGGNEAGVEEREESVKAVSDVLAVSPHTLPLTIRIDKLNRTLPVNNPSSRTLAELDAALLTGVVRHPDSASFGQDGTMFILGHSSYLPTVNNRFYQAFNGIQNLKWGDTITVTSADREYVYQVDNVYEARAQEVVVPIAGTGARLTIATCNSFGSVDDRYIVEAVLLYSEPVEVV